MKTSTPPPSTRPIRTTPNGFGGVDFAGRSGRARTSCDDAGNVTVYAFTRNFTLRWAVEIGASAPSSLLASAWDLAVGEAMA